jgi:hypothetical protein
MRAKSLTIILMLILSFFAGATSASAKDSKLGVAKGDIFYYNMYGVFTSSNPNAVINVPPFEANNTDWVRIEITSVSGSVISHVYTLHYVNGSMQRIEGQTDTARSSSWSSGFNGIPICSANLSTGDPMETVQLTINETIDKDYPDGARETNHVMWNSSVDYGECYFDRQTGMLVELCRVHLYANPATGEVVSKEDVVKMTSASTWVVRKFPTCLAPSLLIVMASLATLIVGTVAYRARAANRKTNGLDYSA